MSQPREDGNYTLDEQNPPRPQGHSPTTEEMKRLETSLGELTKFSDDRPLWAALSTAFGRREHMPLTVGDLRKIAAALSRPSSDVVEATLYTQAEFDECGEIGERDGYEKAMQEIDMLTGGHGEYRYCLGDENSERHCPDAEAMRQWIVDRFEALRSLLSSSEGEKP